MIGQLQEALKTLQSVLDRALKDNEILREQNAYLTKQLFSPRSEKRGDIPGQLAFFDEVESESELMASPDGSGMVTVTYRRERRPKATHDETMRDLPEVERTIDLPDDRKTCAICGAGLACIGREFVRDEIEVIPRKAVRVRIYRNVYGCPACKSETGEASIIKADVPAALIPNSYATASAVALTMHAKYNLGLPLYRQEKDWGQLGVILNRTTLADWIIYCGIHYILPVVDRLHDIQLSREILYCDELCEASHNSAYDKHMIM